MGYSHIISQVESARVEKETEHERDNDSQGGLYAKKGVTSVSSEFSSAERRNYLAPCWQQFWTVGLSAFLELVRLAEHYA